MAVDGPAFVAARTVAEAVDHLAGDEDAVALSGGTSIGLLAGQGLIQPSKLVWLGRVEGLGSITVADGQFSVGAGVTLRQLAGHPLVRSTFPALATAAGVVGNPRVRAVATVGGAIAHGDPRQDVPPALLALGAAVTVAGPSGDRQVPLEGFFTGFMETALRPGEIITGVSVPIVEGQRSEYRRFTPGSLADYPTVAVAAAVKRDGDGVISSARVALGGVGPTAVVVPAAAALAGRPDAGDLGNVGRAAAERSQPVDDRLGSARYKRAMADVWTRRTLAACLAAPPA